jgi:hypothetical protein
MDRLFRVLLLLIRSGPLLVVELSWLVGTLLRRLGLLFRRVVLLGWLGTVFSLVEDREFSSR